MSSNQVIKAASMFASGGQASKVSVIREIAVASALGLAFGFYWQTYHWNENKKWDEFYAAREAAKKAASA